MGMGPSNWNVAGPSGGRLKSALDMDNKGDRKRLYGRIELKRLLGYLRHAKMLVGLGAGGMLVRTLANMAYPYIISIGIDDYISAGDYGGLNTVAIAFIAAVVLAWGGGYLESRCLQYAGCRSYGTISL